MGSFYKNAAKLLSATRFPFWAFRFHVVGLVGTSRFGGGELRVLYAGTEPFLHYFKEMTFEEAPSEVPLGSHNIFDLAGVRQSAEWDIELYRGHQALANLGLFPSAYFVPEWVSGTADLLEQRRREESSKSRRRDRALLGRNDLSYVVTCRVRDLDYFYNEMYLPHMQTKHGDSLFLMTRDEMMSRVNEDCGRLVMIYRGDEAVGGSLIVQEDGRPRLYSQGVLQNKKDLLRCGVGTAIYLYSYDYLLEAGCEEVHMGWSRAQLADGTLYFKQRFGLRLRETSAIGHFFQYTSPSAAAIEYLRRTGFIHRRRGETKATLFRASGADDDDQLVEQHRARCFALGLNEVEVLGLVSSKEHQSTGEYNPKVG